MGELKNNQISFLKKNKSFVIAAVLPFVFWGALIGLWFLKDPATTNNIKSSKNNLAGQISISQLATANIMDSDKDGLSDWEESIYNTDPHNPDSDGDNYLDGEEILSGHNPAQKGPNDLMINYSQSQSKNTSKTATETFAKVALKNFLSNDASLNIDNLSPEKLDSELKKSFENNSEVMSDYKETMRSLLYEFTPPDLDKKIKISENDPDGKKYLAQLNNILIDTTSKYPAVELNKIITAAFQNRNYQEINSAIDYYSYVYNELLDVRVSSDLAPLHKEILRLFYETYKILEATKNWENDPVRATVALEKYISWIEKIENLKNTTTKK